MRCGTLRFKKSFVRAAFGTARQNNFSNFPNIDDEVNHLLRKAEWYQVYDFIELVVDWFQKNCSPDCAENFAEKINNAFRRRGVGWQLIDGKIEIRGEESFEQSVKAAIVATQQSGRSAAEREFHEALTDLSKRPAPDITGAIQHAMAALECVARHVTGDQNATLGALIKNNPGLLPAPLDKAAEKIWGYASEQARHVREGGALDIREAELVVGLAGSLATYLMKKSEPCN